MRSTRLINSCFPFPLLISVPAVVNITSVDWNSTARALNVSYTATNIIPEIGVDAAFTLRTIFSAFYLCLLFFLCFFSNVFFYSNQWSVISSEFYFQ
jgi:hypothetical protein